MKHTPSPVPGTSFCERTAPFRSIKTITPVAFGIFCPHKTMFRIIEIAVIWGFLVILVCDILFAQRFRKAGNTPVSISIFECFGCSFGNFRIRYITELIIILEAVTPYRSYFRMTGLCLMNHRFQSFFGIYRLYPLHPCID